MRLLLILFLFSFLQLKAQQNFFFVTFKDKPNYKKVLYNPSLYISKRAIERRARNKVPLNENDVPPDSGYLAKVAELPLMLYGNSRWLNGCIILASDKSIKDSLENLPFVQKVIYLGPAWFDEAEEQGSETSLENQLSILEQAFENKKSKTDSVPAGKSDSQLRQLKDNILLNGKADGSGVLIAVTDAGFRNLDKLDPFRHLIRNRKILAAYDFVEKEEEVFDNDEHGTAVMSCLGAYLPGLILGAAPQADYILLRTENPATEYLVEEYFWLLAAEFADSAGADIINCSLGYTKHDDKTMGHKYSDLDGKSTVITRAAEIASSKGILVFASAGNEGNDPWKQLSAPADGPSVISVGAIDKFGSYVSFSSQGPTADKRIKPDLVARGKGTVLISGSGKIFEGNGTSYACPLICGMAAQLFQVNPAASALKVKEALLLSCPAYNKPDKYTGAGIPDMELAVSMLISIGDSIIDVRELPDKNFHIAISSRVQQKVTILIKEPVEGDVYKNTFNLKKGINRVSVKPNKKRPAGLYHLSVLFTGKTAEYDFMIP